MAVSKLRRFTRRLLTWLTVFVCALFLCCCLPPYMRKLYWWPLGFAGLAFPYLAVALIFILIFWLIAKPLRALIPFAALLLGYRQFDVLFARHPRAQFDEVKADSVLRIVSWNVGSMYGLSNNTDKRKHNRTEIADVVLNLKPDVICLQEFNHSYTQGAQADNIGLFSKNYPHHFFSEDYNKRNGFYVYGSIIFSKFPIIKTGKIKYPAAVAESLIYADVKFAGNVIRVYTTHLQSYKFTSADYNDMNKIDDRDEEAIEASKSLVKKMKLAFTRRSAQAEIVKTETAKTPYPSVICGDFNDVPNSYTYFKIKDERKDAFLEKSFGIGRTYIALAPTLRIDYILPDKNFTVKQFDMVDEDLSDHIMLVSDMVLSK